LFLRGGTRLWPTIYSLRLGLYNHRHHHLYTTAAAAIATTATTTIIGLRVLLLIVALQRGRSIASFVLYVLH